MKLDEKKILDITVKPYIIYSIINTLFIAMAKYNIGNFNNDVQFGLFISWIISSFTLLFAVGFYDTNDN